MPRPNPLTKDRKALICTLVAEGATVKKAAQDVGCAPATVYKTLALDAAFAEQYAQAREAQLLRWEDELVEIADEASNDMIVGADGVERTNAEAVARSKVRIDTRKWLMAKRMPKKYGDRIEHEHDVAVSFVSRLPQKAADTNEWAKLYAPPALIEG